MRLCRGIAKPDFKALINSPAATAALPSHCTRRLAGRHVEATVCGNAFSSVAVLLQAESCFGQSARASRTALHPDFWWPRFCWAAPEASTLALFCPHAPADGPAAAPLTKRPQDVHQRPQDAPGAIRLSCPHGCDMVPGDQSPCTSDCGTVEARRTIWARSTYFTHGLLLLAPGHVCQTP